MGRGEKGRGREVETGGKEGMENKRWRKEKEGLEKVVSERWK